jgi:hypothetical protein
MLVCPAFILFCKTASFVEKEDLNRKNREGKALFLNKKPHKNAKTEVADPNETCYITLNSIKIEIFTRPTFQRRYGISGNTAPIMEFTGVR